MRDRTAKSLSTLHTTLYRLTAGRLGRRLVANDMLLLSTKGRTSGKTHTVPLLYLRNRGDLIVIASWGGRPTNPEWYRNLLREPKATAQIEGRRIPVVARTADPDERSRLWPQILDAYDGYREYQSKTTRQIPVVILSAVSYQQIS